MLVYFSIGFFIAAGTKSNLYHVQYIHLDSDIFNLCKIHEEELWVSTLFNCVH